MVTNVQIQNFKSIRELEFKASRVNLFIGEPNTGKSNILEALSFEYLLLAPNPLRTFFRFEVIADLFYDQKVSLPILVETNEWRVILNFQGQTFLAKYYAKRKPSDSVLRSAGGFNEPSSHSQFDHTGSFRGGSGHQIGQSVFSYRFSPMNKFPNTKPGILNPPFGDNFVAVLYSDEDLRKRLGSVIRQQGFRLQLKPADNELLITKDVGDELYSYPWSTVSETIRRLVFFMAALETNKDATLLLDEPEANTFPFYTKYLAERIALDESNQYFITTHNPYLLSSIVEKTPVDKLSVFVTRLENFETKVDVVPQEKLSELLELNSDAFFNLDKLVHA